MQIIYRVVLKISYNSATFDFIDPVAACKFADAAKVNNVDGEDGKCMVSIQLLTKEETEKDDKDA
jgi:hypothetical protein